jgi:hypothetical protein
MYLYHRKDDDVFDIREDGVIDRLIYQCNLAVIEVYGVWTFVEKMSSSQLVMVKLIAGEITIKG